MRKIPKSLFLNGLAINKLPPLFLLFSVLLSQNSIAAGAGVLVYCQQKSEVLVLIADHVKPSQVTRGWSSLGGTIQENETPLAAAIREVVEETHGVIHEQVLYKHTDKSKKVVTPGFTIFFAKTPCYSIEAFNQKINSAEAVVERGPYLWLPVTQIHQAVKDFSQQQASLPKSQSPKVSLAQALIPQKAQTDWYFNAFLAAMALVFNDPITPVELK